MADAPLQHAPGVDLPVADQRSQRRELRSVGRARPRLHRSLDAATRRQNPVADDSSRSQRYGGPMIARRLTGILAGVALGCAGSISQSRAVDPPAAANAIRPGDVVRVRIWREPELSGEFTIDETGTVVLPRLGAVTLGDASAGDVRTRLVSAYEQFLSHSSVEVTLLRRLQVLGAVRNPGLYAVDPTMTVEDGLALAGGVTTDGSPDHIELIRQGAKVPIQLSRRTPINDAPIRSGDQLYVPNRGWVSRNPAVAVGILSVIATTAVIVLRR